MLNLFLLALLLPSLHTQAANVLGKSTGVNFFVIQNDGSIYGFGKNLAGQLGIGSTNVVTIPTKMLNVDNALMVSASNDHTCIIDQGGHVKCVGSTTFGKLGVGSTSSTSYLTTLVSSNGLTSGAIKVVAGEDHTCVLLQTGSVRCYGENWNGELGDGSEDHQREPVPVTGFETGGALDISLGSDHTCLITANGGKVMCSGDNSRGQLGDETTTDKSEMDFVHGLGSTSTYVAISSGTNHNCALSSTGAMYCWGDDWEGQLGRDKETSVGYSTIAQQPNGLAGVAVHSIWLGEKNTFAILANDRSVLAFGEGSHGVLGQGNDTDFATPQPFWKRKTGLASITGGTTAVCFMMESDSETVSCLGSNTYNQISPLSSITTTYLPVNKTGLPIVTTVPPTASIAPTREPTIAPTPPSYAPTESPSKPPTRHPTVRPTRVPSQPTQRPTRRPTTSSSSSSTARLGTSLALLTTVCLLAL